MKIREFTESRKVKRLAVLLVISMTLFSIAPRVEAAFVPTDEQVLAQSGDRDMKVVRNAIETKLVRERLKALGYSEDEVNAALSRLSDSERHRLAGKIEHLTSGGVIGAVIAVLIVILLVVVILKLTDKQLVVD
jgi:hypothetical protein